MATEELFNSALESQKADLNEELNQFRQLRHVEAEKEKVVDEILILRKDFDGLWNNCANDEERKGFLKSFIYQVNSLLPAHDSRPKNKLPRDTVSSIPGLLSLKLIAGAGMALYFSRSPLKFSLL